MLNKIIEEDCKKILQNIKLDKFKKKKILILGGNSFLASYIQYSLFYGNINNKLDCKISCISLNDLNKDISFLKKEKFFKFYKQDLTNQVKLKKFLEKKKFDFIFHFATYGQPEKWIGELNKMISLNTSSLETILKYCIKQNSNLLYFSSVDVYDLKNLKTKNKLINENAQIGIPDNKSRIVYSSSKILGEILCEEYKKKYNLKINIVRPAHTYGPGQSINDKRLISQLIKRAIFEKKIYLFDKGESIKTWGYISDITIMFLNLIGSGKKLIYNTSGNNFRSILQIAKIIGYHFRIKKIYFKKNKDKTFLDKEKNIIKITSKRYFKEFSKFNQTNLKKGIENLINWNKGRLN